MTPQRSAISRLCVPEVSDNSPFVCDEQARVWHLICTRAERVVPHLPAFQNNFSFCLGE